jgi:hypothetical protein
MTGEGDFISNNSKTDSLKADLVFDSVISDFHIIGASLRQTLEINSAINGFGMFICTFIFGKLTQELRFGFVGFMIDIKTDLYNKDEMLVALGAICILAYIFAPFASYLLVYC